VSHILWTDWVALAFSQTTGHLQAVMKVLSSDRISFSKDSSIRREALRLAQCVVASCGTAMLPVAPDMLAMLLRGQSLSMLLQGQDATTYRSSAFACMERLSVLTGFSSTAALVAAYRSRILPNPTSHIDHANLDQQLAVLSLILEGGQCMERMYPVIDSAPVPPPLPSPGEWHTHPFTPGQLSITCKRATIPCPLMLYPLFVISSPQPTCQCVPSP
jgi:hypothetical protein